MVIEEDDTMQSRGFISVLGGLNVAFGRRLYGVDMTVMSTAARVLRKTGTDKSEGKEHMRWKTKMGAGRLGRQ
jgi:hypothetical protein